MASLSRLSSGRRDLGIRKWANWLREDLSSRPYVWLWPNFVPPSPFLKVKDPQSGSSRILVEPHLIDAEFRKAWMPFFSVRRVILLLLWISSWTLLVISCLRGLIWIFLGLLVGICERCLAILLELVETSGIWPQGLF